MVAAYVLLAAASYLAFLLVRWNTPLLHRLALSSVAVLDGMLSDAEEEDKLQALESTTGSLLHNLASCLGLFLMAGLLVGASLRWGHASGPMLLFSWQGILAVSLGGTAALFLPKSLPGQPAVSKGAGGAQHSPLDQLLHRMLLDHPSVHKLLMQREIEAWKKRGGTAQPSFLWVTGLARSGTTSMLERLVASGSFQSLHYGNMPMVLAPGLWRRFHRPKPGEKRERSHGDGIMVGLDSAEALEEVFFQAITDRSYVTNDGLKAQELSKEQHQAYLDYQGIALAASDRPEATYVAKNNNALLRCASLRQHNPHFHVVLMFREPLTHAASLQAMHRKYCALQQDDPFVTEYMDWLAHHEFGLHHKPFLFPSSTRPVNSTDPANDLAYWLDLWINHYREALSLDPHNVHFVSYESYCAAPSDVLGKLGDSIRPGTSFPSYTPYTKVREVNGEVPPERRAIAGEIYKSLLEREGA